MTSGLINFYFQYPRLCCHYIVPGGAYTVSFHCYKCDIRSVCVRVKHNWKTRLSSGHDSGTRLSSGHDSGLPSFNRQRLVLVYVTLSVGAIS